MEEDEEEEEENVINCLATGFPKLILKNLSAEKFPPRHAPNVNDQTRYKTGGRGSPLHLCRPYLSLLPVPFRPSLPVHAVGRAQPSWG